MRIVFHTLNAYDMLTGRSDGHVGGAQLQQILVAKELAARGHVVYFIENDADRKREGVVDGIRVVLKARPRRGDPATRAIISAARTIRALKSVNPDVCYRRVLNFDLIPIYLYCRFYDSRMVYGFAHDSELTDDPVAFVSPEFDNPVFIGLTQAILSRTDALIAQNDYQYNQAKRLLGGQVTRIPNAYPASPTVPTPVLEPLDTPVVLWVGTIRPWKRPELFLEMAAEIPQATFVLVGGASPEDPELYDQIERRASELDNVRFEGFVPFEEVDGYFAAADMFVNTSTDEGFPNTFLQAWAQGTPVVSLNVDPDGVIEQEEIGVFAGGSVPRFRQALVNLIEDSARRESLGENGRRHLAENHSVERVTDAYERVFAGE